LIEEPTVSKFWHMNITIANPNPLHSGYSSPTPNVSSKFTFHTLESVTSLSESAT